MNCYNKQSLTELSEVSCVFVHSKVLWFESHALGIFEINLMRGIVKNGDNEVSLLVVLSVSFLFFFPLHQELNMLVSEFLVLGDASLGLTLELLAFLSPLFEMLLAFSRELIVFLHALGDFLLSLSILSEEHLPPTDIVHSLVLVGHQVALNHRTIFHR